MRAQATQASEIRRALDLVQAWVERHDYRGYEPFDGLSSWARPLLFGNLFAERLLMQGIRQFPFNLRPLFGVRPKDSTKGRGYMASGYLALHKTTGEQQYLDKATHCLEWLDQHKSARFQHHSWSNHFDFSSRSGSYTKHDPIIVWTSLIGQAYVEAFEITGKEWFLRIAESACNWILDLPRNRTDRGDCLSYMASAPHWIHNANMLGACLLARTVKHTGNEEYRRVARAAIEYTCSRQLPDGAWLYAEEPMYHWIDNFHTGYNLDSLYFYIDGTGDREFVHTPRQGFGILQGQLFRRQRSTQVLSHTNLSGRYTVRGAVHRYVGAVIGTRPFLPRAGGEGGRLDDSEHAGPEGLLLLPAVSLRESEDSDASLGASHDVQGAGSSSRKT